MRDGDQESICMILGEPDLPQLWLKEKPDGLLSVCRGLNSGGKWRFQNANLPDKCDNKFVYSVFDKRSSVVSSIFNLNLINFTCTVIEFNNNNNFKAINITTDITQS